MLCLLLGCDSVCYVVLGVADGGVVILSRLSGSIIHELMDGRVNEPILGPV